MVASIPGLVEIVVHGWVIRESLPENRHGMIIGIGRVSREGEWDPSLLHVSLNYCRILQDGGLDHTAAYADRLAATPADLRTIRHAFRERLHQLGISRIVFNYTGFDPEDLAGVLEDEEQLAMGAMEQLSTVLGRIPWKLSECPASS